MKQIDFPVHLKKVILGGFKLSGAAADAVAQSHTYSLKISDFLNLSAKKMSNVTHISVSASLGVISRNTQAPVKFDATAVDYGLTEEIDYSSIRFIDPYGEAPKSRVLVLDGEWSHDNIGGITFNSAYNDVTPGSIQYTVDDVSGNTSGPFVATHAPATSSLKEQLHVWPFAWYPDLLVTGQWLPDNSAVVMAKQNHPFDLAQSHNQGTVKCEVHDGEVRFNILTPNSFESKPGLRMDVFISIDGYTLNGLADKSEIKPHAEFKTQQDWWQDIIG